MTQEEVAIFWKDANGWDVRGYTNTLEDLGRFARLVAAKEREACAKVVDEMAKEAEAEQEPSGYIDYYRRKATEIRARGEQA